MWKRRKTRSTRDKLCVNFQSFSCQKPFLMTAIFNTWLPFLLACCHRWNFGDTTLTYWTFEEKKFRYRKNSASYWKKHITTRTYIRWRSKWRRLPLRPFQIDKLKILSIRSAKISQLSLKERSIMRLWNSRILNDGT